MTQNIRDELAITKALRIDQQFMGCLNDIILEYDNKASIIVSVWCKKTRFTFTSIEEFLTNTLKLNERMERLKIEARINSQTSYSYDEISIEFHNEPDIFLGNDKVSFNFNDPAGYYTLKNQIQTLINNHKLPYSFFSKNALITPLCILSISFICLYTALQNIVFPKPTQYIITLVHFIVGFLPFLSPSIKIKRFLFPRYEFSFGVNKYKNKQATSIRNTIGISIILAFVVGLAVNIVSNFIM